MERCENPEQEVVGPDVVATLHDDLVDQAVRSCLERLSVSRKTSTSELLPSLSGVFDRFLHGHGFLRVIAVHPDHRRQGIAAALVSALEAECPTDRFFTATEESNEAMQRLCEALGFVRSRRIEGLEEGETELIFLKRLPGRR